MIEVSCLSPKGDKLKDDALEKQLQQLSQQDDLHFLNFLLIRKEYYWHEVFENLMLLVAFINVFGNAYVAAFGES